MFLQGLEITVHLGNHDIIIRLWDHIYALLLKTKNIYEILEFLEEENDRWLANQLPGDHLLLKLISHSLGAIKNEEDLKLRYIVSNSKVQGNFGRYFSFSSLLFESNLCNDVPTEWITHRSNCFNKRFFGITQTSS